MSAALVVYLFLSPSCPMSERYRPDVERLRADFPAVRFEEPPGPIHGARVTPSVVVTQGGRVRYRGRIDDRSPSLGIYRAPVRQDLREALEALQAGKPVQTPETAAVGCAISVSPPKQDAAVTFAKHVAPILFQHCAPCHRDLTRLGMPRVRGFLLDRRCPRIPRMDLPFVVIGMNAIAAYVGPSIRCCYLLRMRNFDLSQVRFAIRNPGL